MPYFNLIPLMKMQGLAFKKGVLNFWFTQFLLPWLAFDTIYILILVAALYCHIILHRDVTFLHTNSALLHYTIDAFFGG